MSSHCISDHTVVVRKESNSIAKLVICSPFGIGLIAQSTLFCNAVQDRGSSRTKSMNLVCLDLLGV